MRRGTCLQAVVVLLAAGFFGCNTNPAGDHQTEKHAHYAIDLEINPLDQAIEVTGTMSLPCETMSAGQLELYLHDQLEVTSLSADIPLDFRIDSGESENRFLPEAMKIIITPEDSVRHKDFINIKFAYRGQITRWPGWSANVIGDEWTEIGLYFPWFPFSFDLGVFTYDLNIACDSKYGLVSIGEVRKTEAGWSVSCPDPTNDIVICLADNFRIHESELGRNKLRIYHFSISDSTLEALSADIAEITRIYNKWFGTIGRDLCVVESKRPKGGGYGRLGGIFLGGFDGKSYIVDREAYNRYLAHEIAHQWWYKAPTSSWEDWLNESFAEYSALSLIRETFGAESFSKLLEKKKSGIAGTSPVWEFDRSGDPDAYKILYSKGPALLYMLEDRIGREEFLRLCSQAFDREVTFTTDFLDLLETSEGEQTRIWFEKLLKTF
jgi:hypothetical protein